MQVFKSGKASKLMEIKNNKKEKADKTYKNLHKREKSYKKTKLEFQKTIKSKNHVMLQAKDTNKLL